MLYIWARRPVYPRENDNIRASSARMVLRVDTVNRMYGGSFESMTTVNRARNMLAKHSESNGRGRALAGVQQIDEQNERHTFDADLSRHCANVEPSNRCMTS